MKTIRLIAFALAAGITAGPAQAAPAVMLNNALITQISKADKPAFH